MRVAGYLFDADTFNFACALGIFDELKEALTGGELILHFVQNVAKEIKGPNRDRLAQLQAIDAARIHRFTLGDETGRMFNKLFSNRHRVPDGPVHIGECAIVAWARTQGDNEPIVIADKGGRALAKAHGLTTLSVGEFVFECVRYRWMSRDSAARCLDRWQPTQGRPADFDFDTALARYCAPAIRYSGT